MYTVRFAPSPTGDLHIGSARTALFNFLFAKKHKAKFILRIEDTDKERSTQKALDAIINGLKTLDIHYDELFFQSKRIERHKEVIYKLVEKGLAYYDEDKEKGKAIRIKIPKDQKISFNDLIRGEITFNSNDIESFVLLRSDGTPTYMSSVVIDDIDMKISHIIRGEDHIANTPKQMLLYMAIGAEIPQFAHIPLIHGEDGQKLSKRKNATAVEEYIDMGYLKEAICNYLLHLGGGYTKDIITRSEAIEAFDINKIGKSPSRLDFDKLNFINLEYVKKLDNSKIIEHIKSILSKDKNITITKEEEVRLLLIIDEFKKISNFKKMAELAYCFTDKFNIEKDSTDVLEKNEEVLRFLNYIEENIETIKFLDIVENIKDFSSKENISQKTIYQTLRYILIGKLHSVSVKSILLSLQDKLTKERTNNYFKKTRN